MRFSGRLFGPCMLWVAVLAIGLLRDHKAR